jgi:hypothetical protein
LNAVTAGNLRRGFALWTSGINREDRPLQRIFKQSSCADRGSNADKAPNGITLKQYPAAIDSVATERLAPGA